MKRTLIGIAIGVVVLSLLGGGAAAAWLLLGALSPEEAVAAVVEKLDDVTSYGFTMDATIETGGESIDMEFEGVAEEGATPAETSLSMDGSMSLLGQSIKMAEVMADGKLYIKYDPDPFGTPDQWYEMDFDLSGVQSTQSGGNPSQYLQYMEAYSEIEQLDDATIDGMECKHYRLAIDPTKLADMAVSNTESIAEQLPDEIAAQLDPEQMRKMYEGATINMELYIGDDGMPRRQVIDMELLSPQPMTMTVTMDLFDFGKPAEISAPAGAVPLSTKLGGSGS